MIWYSTQSLRPRQFTCGFCGNKVASDKGYSHQGVQRFVLICPNCDRPTYFDDEDGMRVPGVDPGNEVMGLPKDVEALYQEARSSAGVGASTASVLASRKLLMNIAVAQGAKEGDSFMGYVEFLSTAGFVPPNGKHWVDHIRQKGNEATHEIQVMAQEDAEELIVFSEMLLKFVFEFPGRVPKKPSK